MDKITKAMPQMNTPTGSPAVCDYKADPEKAAKEEAARFNAVKLEPKDGIYCNICYNREMIAHAVRGEGMFRNNWYVENTYCSCVKQRAALAKRKASGMEDALDHVGAFTTAQDWQAAILTKARLFTSQTAARCFFIGGQSGAGKTHISTLICKELIETGHALLYKKWVDVIEKLTDFHSEDKDRIWDEITNIRVLYIDDLLKPSGSAFNSREVRATFDMIDRRYTKRDSITVISSELTSTQISQIDEATARRIKEMAGDFVIDISKDPNKIYRAVERRYDSPF